MQNKPTTPPNTVLGFDFGTQKIGIAVGQVITGTANPLTIIKARDGIPNWQQVEQIINEWQPDAFVVGWPINMDGTESEMSRRANKFANRLNGRFNRPSYLIDERLTSFEARQQLAEEGTDPALVDSVAAALMIESWYAEL